MNLSDLVHRTAGDNKVLKGTENNLNTNNRLIPSSNNTNITPKSSNNSNNVFQQPVNDPSSPSTVFSTFARQDQPFLFAMPNVRTSSQENSICLKTNFVIIN
jgi:hypothetical protein